MQAGGTPESRSKKKCPGVTAGKTAFFGIMDTEQKRRVVSWFSCGAASAVATKLALKQYSERVEIVYQDTGSEHPDNKRFLKDCERWFGREITVLKSKKYNSIWEVFEKTRYLVGPMGARCTSELKRKLAEEYITWGPLQDVEVFGYTVEEEPRLKRFRSNNPERIIECPLIDKALNKTECLAILEREKIQIPKMYELGYKNNNCIGCVKGGAGYWNKIRKDFPDVFARMAAVERELDIAINKRYVDGERMKVFLDELPEEMGNFETEPSISCGLFCDAVVRNIST